MTLYYNLQIDAPKDQYEEINIILGVESNSPHSGWQLGRIQRENDEYIPYIDFFLSILDGKYEALGKIGINRNDISIWKLYEYEGQCNMEFSPKDMYRLGKEGIVLCVSCWEE